MNKLWIILGVLMLLAPAAQVRAAEVPVAVESPDQAVSNLRAILPEEASVVTDGQVKVIEEAGSTKRLDAAILLIRALAFNSYSGSSNEWRPPVDMMPAAAVLRNQFGLQVAPLLIMEGVSTEKEWLQKRIVLVIRSFEDQGGVVLALEAFSLKESSNPRAKRFQSLLEQKDLNIEWLNPSAEDAMKFIEGIKKKREQGKPPAG